MTGNHFFVFAKLRVIQTKLKWNKIRELTNTADYSMPCVLVLNKAKKNIQYASIIGISCLCFLISFIIQSKSYLNIRKTLTLTYLSEIFLLETVIELYCVVCVYRNRNHENRTAMSTCAINWQNQDSMSDQGSSVHMKYLYMVSTVALIPITLLIINRNINTQSIYFFWFLIISLLTTELKNIFIISVVNSLYDIMGYQK